jgi:hypothetical protein
VKAKVGFERSMNKLVVWLRQSHGVPQQSQDPINETNTVTVHSESPEQANPDLETNADQSRQLALAQNHNEVS